MAPSMPSVDPRRIRSYIYRLPLFTRIILLLIVGLWAVSVPGIVDVVQWGALIPNKVGLSSMYRINTYPVVHKNLIHMLLNVLTLASLMERFENEHGTLTTLAFFAGPLSTLPAGIYLLFEKGIWRGNNAILGASVWVFLLLSIEAIKQYRSNPYFNIGSYKIPVWTTPLVIALFTSVLIPNTSFLGHLCGCAVGYIFGLGYLKILAPPEKILRWVEGKLNLLGRLPHYVSVDQKTYGRYGVLPSNGTSRGSSPDRNVPLTYLGSTQRLGP